MRSVKPPEPEGQKTIEKTARPQLHSARGGRPTREAATHLGDHILETALVEYSRLGIDGVTLEQVARAAQVSKRTLYSRFGDRKGLLLAAIERGIERILASLSALPAPGSLSSKLRHVGTDMVRLSLHPDTIGLERLIASLSRRYPEVYDRVAGKVQAARLSVIRSILEEAGEEGQIDVDQIDLASSIIFDALVTNARRRALLDQISIDDIASIHRYLDAAIDIVLHGIATSQQGGSEPERHS